MEETDGENAENPQAQGSDAPRVPGPGLPPGQTSLGWMDISRRRPELPLGGSGSPQA